MTWRVSGWFLLRWQHLLLPPGPQVWGKRPGPAAVGRGAPQVGPKTKEWRTTPAATKKRRATFPLGMANALRPGLGSNSSQPRKAGWIPQGGGRPLLWRFFRLFLIAEKETPAERKTKLARHCHISDRKSSLQLTSPLTQEILSRSSRQSSHSRSPAFPAGDQAESHPPRSTPSPRPRCGIPWAYPG